MTNVWFCQQFKAHRAQIAQQGCSQGLLNQTNVPNKYTSTPGGRLLFSIL